MKTRCLSITQVLHLKKDIQQQLEQLRQDLAAEQAAQRAELTLVDGSEFRDRAEAAVSAAANIANITHISQLGDEIRECEHALSRIASGEYGACEQCADEIELNRLTANPVATLCMSCQSKQEYVRNTGRAAAF
ncbi:TraR/DksA family transcriptional regulator [Amphritea sp. HPY]|uniref:TraR/DksA family transcriptional regulator n=1 Tax=Amphritea sp. HPY TaxID=3421652 RepID=UPI003D7CD5BA